MMQNRDFERTLFSGLDSETSELLSIEKDEDRQSIVSIGRALSVPLRIDILRLLNRKPMMISQIAEELGIPLSSCIFHIRTLEEAKLVKAEYSTTGKGTQRWYSYAKSKMIFLSLRQAEGSRTGAETAVYEVGVGDFIDAEFSENCGMASEQDMLMLNDPASAFLPERHEAQILWSAVRGKFTYAVPGIFARGQMPERISVSMELCSECLGYNHDYKSDITFSLNGHDLCTYTSPGDFGNRYGTFTPSWWYPESTKYGKLVVIDVDASGIYLNGQLCSEKNTIETFAQEKNVRMLFQIEVKKDAKHAGGLNLFGKKFGDYDQGIVFRAYYPENTKKA